MGKRLVRPLMIGAILIVVLLVLRFLLPLLLEPAAAQAASFITVFLAILMAYIFFIIVPAAILLNGRIAPGIYGVVEKIIIAGIVLGVVGLFQPWIHLGFRVGFHILLASTLAFVAWSHITPRAVRYDEETTGPVTVHEVVSE
jgi:hypothetical protein